MKKVIITGANGFIGGYLARFLAQQGVYVLALDICAEQIPQNTHIEYRECNLCDAAIIKDFCNIKDIDVVYHLAWIGVGADNRNDYEVQMQNIGLSLNVLNVAKQLGASKTIVLGSASEYALCNEIIDGYHPPAPADAYGAAKSACHVLCETWARQHSLPFIWTLVSSIYGPGRDDNNILSYTIKALLKKEKPSFTKLEQIWDYIYINDLIAALNLIGLKGISGQTYAIGSGFTKSLREYILHIRDAIDLSLPLGIGDIPYKSGIPDNSRMDIQKLQKDTGFSPSFTFEDGINETIRYFKECVR